MKVICSDNTYSTTRLLSTGIPPVVAGDVPGNPQSRPGKSEGGLRTRGYFKNHFEKHLDAWYACNSSGDRLYSVSLPVDMARTHVPIVTVITVVYNGVANVEETIKSVLNQSYPNVEYIIVDGGSTDGTLEVIKKFDHAVDYWISEPDGGIYDAMNKGVELSTGRWLNILNVGDVLNGTDAFNGCGFDDESVVIYYSDTILLKNNGYSIENADLKKKRFVHQSFIYHKRLHKLYGKYLCLPGVTISDYLFFSRIWKDSNSIKLDNPISVFRCGGISSGDSHVYQRMAVDIMCGNVSAFVGALRIIAFPFYRFMYVYLIKPCKSLRKKILDFSQVFS